MALDQSQIGSWLKEIRDKRDISRRQAAIGAGTTEKNVQRYEIEGVSAPTEVFLRLVMFYEAIDELKAFLAGQGPFALIHDIGLPPEKKKKGVAEAPTPSKRKQLPAHVLTQRARAKKDSDEKKEGA